MYCSCYFRLEGCVCWTQFFMGHLGSMNDLSTSAHICSKTRGLCPSAGSRTKFVYLSDMQWSKNETEAQTTIVVQECYSHQSVWDVAQACSQRHLGILLIQLEQKGVPETHWNKQRKPKENAAGRVWTWCCLFLLQLSKQQQTGCVLQMPLSAQLARRGIRKQWTADGRYVKFH